ncbi:MAG: NADPH-dependent F420 reductase, partial [bacterium]|nr:NADPH-dependent F420 reductase [Candidatus Kapabacteria bacterium]
FADAGHEVGISNSRGPESLKAQVEMLGDRVKAMTVEQTAEWAEIIFLAVPWRRPEALPPVAFAAGKIVIDAMNPYREGGGLEDLGTSSSSEETAKRLPSARIVKAFNTIYFKHLGANGNTTLPTDQRHAIFLAGDDDDAKRVVAELIEQIGFAPVDTGSLRDGGRRQQPGTSIYNMPMRGQEANAIIDHMRASARATS